MARSRAFATTQADNALIVTLPVRVDVSVAREMLEVLEQAVQSAGHNIVLDLSETQAIDSTALGAIVQVLKKCRAEAGDLVLSCVGESVRRVLAITRLDRVVALYETTEQATARFVGASP